MNAAAIGRGKVRPQFSMRMILISVALIALYLASWKVTNQYGVERGLRTRGLGTHVDWIYGRPGGGELPVDCRSPMPFLVSRDTIEVGVPMVFPRKYYVWLFGFKWKLPYESTWESEFNDPEFCASLVPDDKCYRPN